MLEIRMGRKTKISRVFGHSLGRHRKIRQNKYLGRPIYTITKSKHLRKEKLRLKIKSKTVHECSLNGPLQTLRFLFRYEIQNGGYGRT